MGNQRKKQIEMETIELNEYTFFRYYNWIKDLAISLFEWENLPEGTDSNFLERTLFDRGQILFFYDELLEKFLHLPFTNTGSLDVYGYPINRQAYSVCGYTYKATNENSIIIYNNCVAQPDHQVARYYAKQITEIKRSIDVNVKTQKFPFILTGPQSQVETLKRMYNKISQNEPIIFSSDKFSEFNQVSVLQTQAPYVAQQLQDLYNEVMGEVSEYFGINASSDKKERMIVSEVVNGIGMTEANRQIRLKRRKDACSQINEMFGTNIDVKFRKDVDIMEQMMGFNMQYSLQEGMNFGLEEGELHE